MSSTKGNVPNIVALEVLKKNGIDIEKLKNMITRGVGAEFTTYYYYTILRMHCTGLEGEGIKEIVEDARIEDRNHFEAIVPRLYELGRYKFNSQGSARGGAVCYQIVGRSLRHDCRKRSKDI